MSALERRRRTPPDHRVGTEPASPRDSGPSASTLDGQFEPSSRTAWQTWEDVPFEVLTVLEEARCLPSAAFVSGAIPPAPAVDHHDSIESAEAWAVGNDFWTLIEASRPRTPRGVPARPWALTVRRYRYVGEVKDRYGAVAVDSDTVGSREPSVDEGREQPAVLDVLPSAVRRQILTTVSAPVYQDDFLLQERFKGRPFEHRAGVVRASSQQLIAVLATRRIEPRRRGSVRDAEALLASTPWYVQALTARFGAEEVVTLSAVDDDVALDAPGAIALPPSPPTTGRNG